MSVGRLIEKKGFDDLVRAAARLKETGAAPFRVVIVGDGPLEDALRAQIDSLECGDVVELAGAKSQPDIIELLSAAQVFALPCVTEKGGGKDNLPTVIMEAMASALPCVSTRLAGVPEMVVEGETGLLTDEGHPEAFADCLAQLLADPQRCERMGLAGQARARELFAKENTACSLRNYLVGYGSVRLDLALLRSSPKLALSYIAQLGRRVWRGIRRRPPSRFAIAEREARRTQRSG